eukprot:scaffold49323_cov45-Phaeocystis_antarctica.AAC.1
MQINRPVGCHGPDDHAIRFSDQRRHSRPGFRGLGRRRVPAFHVRGFAQLAVERGAVLFFRVRATIAIGRLLRLVSSVGFLL